MLTIKKSTLRKTGVSAAILLLLALLIVIMTPGQISFADGEATTCDGGVADGVCSATENSDLCAADCECVDNGVTDPGEGYLCKDVVGPDEYLSSACGTPATVQDEDGNWQCPSGTSAHDGTTKTLAEFNGVCWDACECEGLCTEDAGESGESSESGGCGQYSYSGGDLATARDAWANCTQADGGGVCEDTAGYSSYNCDIFGTNCTVTCESIK